MRNRHIIVAVTGSLQDKGKKTKDFHFYNNADEMKKSVSKPLIFFSEKEDLTVDVDIGYVGRSNN